MKIFFFQKRNPQTGELLEEIVDAEERIAWDYWSSPRHFKYLGWSNGQFISAVRNSLPRLDVDSKTGMKKPAKKAVKDKIYEAARQEIEFARNNPDKTPPRDMTKMRFQMAGATAQATPLGDLTNTINKMAQSE